MKAEANSLVLTWCHWTHQSQLTTQQKEKLRESKNDDTSVYKFVFYTLGPVYEDPDCAEAKWALASQKKILNTCTPF